MTALNSGSIKVERVHDVNKPKRRCIHYGFKIRELDYAIELGLRPGIMSTVLDSTYHSILR